MPTIRVQSYPSHQLLFNSIQPIFLWMSRTGHATSAGSNWFRLLEHFDTRASNIDTIPIRFGGQLTFGQEFARPALFLQLRPQSQPWRKILIGRRNAKELKQAKSVPPTRKAKFPYHILLVGGFSVFLILLGQHFLPHYVSSSLLLYADGR